MKRKCMKGMVILAALLMATISLSLAACPRANSDYFTGAQCGAVLNIPAPGILANDNRDPGAVLKVVDAEEITINPKYGDIDVREDGSFTYVAAADMNSSTTIGFYYNITDGKCTTTRHALVKIVVTCKCQVKVPQSPIYYCMPVTIDEIRADLMKRGAGCVGCGTPGIIDLSDVNVNVEGCYPYYVTGCKGCNEGQGEICLVGLCVAEADDIEMCEGSINRTQLLEMARRNSSCVGNCMGPVIDDHNVTYDSSGYATGGYYIAICESPCGVHKARGEVIVWELCDVTVNPLYVCPGTDLDTVIGWAEENSSCDNCQGADPVIDPSDITVDSNGNVTGGSYIAYCTVGPGCTSSAKADVIVETCAIDALGYCFEVPSFKPGPTEGDILGAGLVSCTCGDPVIDKIEFVENSSDYLQLWHYWAHCETDHGCKVYNQSDFEWGSCGQCPCVPVAPDLRICEKAYTVNEVKAMIAANATCDCDTNEAIEYSPDPLPTDSNGLVTKGTYEYRVICDPDGDICPTRIATGKIYVEGCSGPCTCKPKAPLMCTCLNDSLEDSDFILKGARCEGSNCPTPVIDDDDVDYYKAGKYQYKVYCLDGCEPATGTVCVEGETCGVNAGDYGTGYLKYNDEVIGTADISIAFSKLNAELHAADGWTIEDSKMYAGVTAVNGCNPIGWSDDLSIALGNIPGWHCGDTLHANVYAKMIGPNGGAPVETCTGDMAIDDYFDIECDLTSCWSCGCI